QQPGSGGVIARKGGREAAPGAHPAVGGGLIAWVGDGTVEVRSQTDATYVLTLPAPGADAVAVSAGWVAWRARESGGDALFASPLAPAAPAPAPAPRRVAGATAPAQLGRPALAGDRLLFHFAEAGGGSRIDQIVLAGDHRTTLRSAPRALLLNPSAFGSRLLYVRSTYQRQQLRIGLLRPRSVDRDRSLY